MKRGLSWAAAVVPLTLSAGSLLAGETQFSGENWFRYTQEMEDRDTRSSELKVERIYLRWNHKHADRLESRITVEMFSSEKDANGAGLKLKDGYVKFNQLVPEGDITVGLQKNYFGRVYDWEYWPIVKAMGEKYEVIHGSRDYGVSVGGYIPKGYGTWRLEAVNGEGYKKTGSLINTELAYMGDLRLMPFPGVTLGGSYVQENTGPDTLAYELRRYYTGLIRLAKGPIDIWGQWLAGEKGNKDDPTAQIGFMAFPKFHLGYFTDIDLEFFGRFDRWDPDTDIADDAEYTYVAGLNYYFSRREGGNPGVVFQIAVEREQGEAADAEPTDRILGQLRWEWSTP